MRRGLTAALAAVLALSLAACGKSIDSTGSGKLPAVSKPAGQTSETSTSAPKTPDVPDAPELAALRKRITDSGGVIGVAYLGFGGEVGSMRDAAELLQHSAYAQRDPFLLTLPEDAFVNAGGEELYALVPAGRGDGLTVYPAEIIDSGSYQRGDAPLCRGKAGEVLLVRCNVSDLYANVCVETAGEQFYPMLSLMDGSVYMEGDCFDFTIYEALEEPGDPGGSSSERGEWLLRDDETDLRMATELLCAADEVQHYLDLGMGAQYTGEHELVDGRECWLFALGTERDDQFVRERYYAVCDNCIYGYDALSDSWQMLGAG